VQYLRRWYIRTRCVTSHFRCIQIASLAFTQFLSRTNHFASYSPHTRCTMDVEEPVDPDESLTAPSMGVQPQVEPLEDEMNPLSGCSHAATDPCEEPPDTPTRDKCMLETRLCNPACVPNMALWEGVHPLSVGFFSFPCTMLTDAPPAISPSDPDSVPLYPFPPPSILTHTRDTSSSSSPDA
jgi:hypothetical protein